MSESKNISNRYAVVVGVNDYSGSPMPNLAYCANDAQAFYEALIHYSHYDADKVVLFADGIDSPVRRPTYSDILSEINSMCEKAGKEDSILVFFAGHGTRDESDSYLLTKEYRKNVLADSSIAMSKVNQYFERSDAKFKLRFFDACHSGRTGIRGMPNPNVEEHLIVTAEGWGTLASCKEDQFAHEVSDVKQGIFSYFIVKGLSGAAAIDGSRVTLDNLKVYVMDNTIELSKKLGLEQTPVFSGEQAGNLLLAKVGTRDDNHLPETLIRIEKVEPIQLAPAADNTTALLSGITNRLSARSDVFAFVAVNQEEKLEVLGDLTKAALRWAQERANKDNTTLPGDDLLIVENQKIEDHPLNRKLGQYLSTSKVKSSIEWEYLYETVSRTKQVPVRERYGYGLGNDVTRYIREEYEEQVVSGIKEANSDAQSAVIIKFVPKERIFPICGMTISFLPSTFGAYALCFFASTNLIKNMKEQWSSNSFAAKNFVAIPSREVQSFDLGNWLAELYAQFVSFIAESIDAREQSLVQLGALPNTPLT